VYYADDFDSPEAETQRSDDPMAYILDVDWTTLMQRKFCAIRAGWVLFVSFRMVLAVQQASHFSQDCYVDFHDDIIRAVPDRLFVCAISTT
jgi:hypothetical protein